MTHQTDQRHYIHYIRWRTEEWEAVRQATERWARRHGLPRVRPVDFVRAAALRAAAETASWDPAA